MKVTDLPAEVLGSVLRRVSQSDRVACFTACKALSHAAQLPTVWDSVTFTDLDKTAVGFALTRSCRRIVIESDRPDDIAWFLHTLADLGHEDVIHELRIRLGAVQRVPEELFVALGRHAELRQLSLDVAFVHQTCEVFFARDHALAKLHTLEIRELADERSMVVWFQGSQNRFESLRRLDLVVAMSDALSQAPAMPALREAVYRWDPNCGEVYDDLTLKGATLDVLELDVHAGVDKPRLFGQLRDASVTRLVLHCSDTRLLMLRPLSPALRELTFCMVSDWVEIEIDFDMLTAMHPGLERIAHRVTAAWILEDPVILDDCEHSLTFRFVPSVAHWTRYFAKVRLDVDPTTRVGMVGT